MQISTGVSGLLLAVGLLVGGCGVDDATGAQSNLETRKDELPSCYGQSFTRQFYSDPGFTTMTGRWECYCGEGSAFVYGNWQAAPFYQDFNVQDCPW
ncbi:hypothetical protein [Pyxidicoccus sp. MSG2]|uniref:hypothetical protein n=1 Tax=Pyxidicoccus sp. MSG2 TaxID=2996790 RepID=UPI00226F1610|nr:hypothetical protein [Pyxidicoccus sp. MSG2]MCY1015014.1 hypothetical protein [Pyxidicoccus sp. MSG2]